MQAAFRWIMLCLAAVLLVSCARSGVEQGEPVAEDKLAGSAIVVVGLHATGFGKKDIPVTQWKTAKLNDDRTIAPDGMMSRSIEAPMSAKFAILQVEVPKESAGGYLFLSGIESDDADTRYCGGSFAPVVRYRAGEVVYAGTVMTRVINRRLFVEHAYDGEAARKYVAATHPELASRLVGRKFVFRRVQPSFLSCF